MRIVTSAAFLIAMLAIGRAYAGEEEAGKPPPLPLHTFEGSGGAFTTLQAYLVNPPAEGSLFGLPAFGYIHVNLGNEKHLESFTVTENVGGRLELGYAFNLLDMGDLPEDIERAFGDTVTLRNESSKMHTISARYSLFTEGALNRDWLPALTLGVHYKQNTVVDDVDRDLGGALRALGIEDDQGFDYTVVATKHVPVAGVPVFFSAGARVTEAAHAGLLGFTGEWKVVGEAGVCAPITPDFWVAAEYRQKPSTYDEVPGLLEDEDDWWTIDIAYLANEHATISLGYGHFGKLLNHRANRVFGIAVKYEF